MRIVPVPCLQDNYAYLVVCEATNRAAVVDPSEAEPVLAAADREGVTLVAIWTTHHHWDHTGGNDKLVEALPDLAVVGYRADEARVPRVTQLVDEGDEVAVGDEVRARIIHNPGHTTGAISFYLEAHKAVFTGDTLFLGGCGRMFEGTPPMFHESLMKLAALPGDTQVYCGHEYTAANLKFAAAVEPNNHAIAERAEAVAALGGAPSVPAPMSLERETNPFLRAAVPHVADAARANHDVTGDGDAAIFGALRGWKDNFRG